MRLLTSIALLISITIVFSIGLSADQENLNDITAKQIEDQKQFFERFTEAQISGDSVEGSRFSQIGQTPSDFDSLTRARYLESYQEYYKYRVTGFQHRQKVFKWQLTSSKIIFTVVVLLVLMGIIFSGLQFRKGSIESKTELEVSKMGLKVSSSILGVIVLVISLLFFYLYLVHIYPIQEIF